MPLPNASSASLRAALAWFRVRMVGWDRTRARQLVGGGLPDPPFRLRDGISFPPWPRFPRPPYNPGRPDLPDFTPVYPDAIHPKGQCHLLCDAESQPEHFT